MVQQIVQPQKVSPKLQQFLEEVNELQDKYLYALQATLRVTAQGIVPVLTVGDKVPTKGKAKLKEKKGKKNNG